ncbi:flagellar biosynthesis anti-sigma factor FlgM [Enterovibrio norvegicus FF-33]|uniref:flagellar biosynthesis anti-sigma factor FlgM n=1 Tax=Enterovibrio TaxID=188143 RepID=UPI0002FC9B0C|nr:flagellar biosynthesis anti-sigma factor FlgM [Enterovibrio norvegicus]OEE70385.1 flagellar biosynthesis anti-sigma factor FlgM [Enterovibrio norvegicus FF-33]
MKIDKVAGGHIQQSSLNQTATKSAETPVRSSVVETQLNTNTAAISKAQQELASMPNIDMAKVEQIRTALQRGELSLDMQALSQAVMQFHTGHE